MNHHSATKSAKAGTSRLAQSPVFFRGKRRFATLANTVRPHEPRRYDQVDELRELYLAEQRGETTQPINPFVVLFDHRHNLGYAISGTHRITALLMIHGEDSQVPLEKLGQIILSFVRIERLARSNKDEAATDALWNITRSKCPGHGGFIDRGWIAPIWKYLPLEARKALADQVSTYLLEELEPSWQFVGKTLFFLPTPTQPAAHR